MSETVIARERARAPYAKPSPAQAKSAVARKLSHYVDLREEELDALDSLVQHPRLLAPHTDLIREGDRTDGVFAILAGWACRYKVLPSGERQIMAYFIAGDLCDQRIFILRRMDHCIGTLTASTVAVIPAEAVIDLTDRCPRIARALWWSTLVDEAITREWVVNVGQRDAKERVAHLICEMYVRLCVVGLTDGLSFDLPVSQMELADTTGLSAVHVNRTLQALRASGLITLKNRRLTILDFDRLADKAMFNPDYLHLERIEGHCC
jgi:CRP-like cAMP-binding protein